MIGISSHGEDCLLLSNVQTLWHVKWMKYSISSHFSGLARVLKILASSHLPNSSTAWTKSPILKMISSIIKKRWTLDLRKLTKHGKIARYTNGKLTQRVTILIWVRECTVQWTFMHISHVRCSMSVYMSLFCAIIMPDIKKFK